MNEDYQKAKKNLILLYLTVKIRKEEEAENITKELLESEQSKLINLPLSTIVEYIKSSIDTIVAMKLDETQSFIKSPLMKDDANEARYYETLLRKEEKAIRHHICIENQLKLNLEKVLESYEEILKENSVLKEKLKKTKIGRNSSDDHRQAATISEEFSSMKNKLQKYEEQHMQFIKTEDKLKKELMEKNKEIKLLEIKTKHISTSYYPTKDNKNVNRYNSSPNIKSNSKRKVVKEMTKVKDLVHNSPLILEKIQMEDKLDKYRKIVDKNIDDLTRNKNQTYLRSCASISYMKERTIDNELSEIVRKNDELSQRLNDATRKVMMYNDKKSQYMMKRMKAVNSIKNFQMKKKPNPAGTLHKKNQSAVPLVINQSEVPFVNNINIYSSQNDLIQNASKLNQVNLRQYIFTKCGTTNILKKPRQQNKYS